MDRRPLLHVFQRMTSRPKIQGGDEVERTELRHVSPTPADIAALPRETKRIFSRGDSWPRPISPQLPSLPFGYK
ncbi:hypothetical protein HanIR_Chr16g0825661 [Helianthus annuus]|nr:hypothetical protein HanIR_Chr16g0825661 [Helianthus annuus]